MDLLDFPYAERDAADARTRIRSDLVRIVDACRAADPSLDALVLTGGFSRGEGTIRDGAPVNDYDLVAVRSRPGGRRRYAHVSELLTRDLDIEVDLMPVWSARLPQVGRKLFWLDLRLGGRVIHGDPAALERLRRFEPARLDPRESARLLGNRAAGLLLALPPPGHAADERLVDTQSAKAVLAAMDAQLLHEGLYAAKLRERLLLAKGHPEHALYACAVDWKLGDGSTVAPRWEDARRALLDAVRAIGAERFADGWTERAFHLLRAKRFRTSPSRDVRRRAWEMLGAASLAAGLPPELKASFFAERARTLQ